MVSKKRKQNTADKYKKTVLIVIAIAAVAVVAGLLCSFLLNSERLVKNKISELATEYYEDYFYEKLASSDKFKQIKDLDSAMEKYRTNGFSPVKLRDLLLYDNQKNQQYRDYLSNYCDEDKTAVTFYIDPPYERNSYHYSVYYSCNF